VSWRKSAKRAMAPLARVIPSPVSGTPGAILCYHSIGRRSAPEVVAVDTFRRHIELLTDRFRPVSVAELVDRIGEPDDGGPLRVAVTFDDGYKGVIEFALPLLVEQRMDASAYILPGLWGQTARWPSDAPQAERRLWDEQDVYVWRAAGMGVGSHGSHHIDLSRAPAAVVDEEVRGSKRALEAAVGSVEGFCYPWGRASAVAQGCVRKAGFRYALAGGYSRHHAVTGLFALGRITVDHDDTVEDLHMKLRGGYDWLNGLGHLRSRMGTWRSS
jgi:peptidoglycan/xylan/chitin deacetylase (PgdA/CDA1 family)